MQINRLFEIVYILLNKKKVTAKEMADRFEISQRTVYRDIETLCEAGVPIYTTKGKGGGISLLDNFVLNKSILSKQEQYEVISALQALNAIHYPNVDEVLSRISALFNHPSSNWIEVDFSDWSESRKEAFIIIKDAIITKQVISFDYYNSYSQKITRTVEPLQMRFKDKAWYLLAFCRLKQAIRVFKITRIKKLKVVNESFERDIPKEQINTEQTSLQSNTITLKLKINASQAYRVYDEFDEKQIVKQKDESYIVTVSYPDGEWVDGYILSFGNWIEVLEPLTIRERIKDKLKIMLKNHS